MNFRWWKDPSKLENDNTREKTIHSVEYDHLLKRIAELHSNFEILKINFESLERRYLSSNRDRNSKPDETEKDLNSNELYLG